MTGVQLEVGDTATSFEHRSTSEELNVANAIITEFQVIQLDQAFWNGISNDGFCC